MKTTMKAVLLSLAAVGGLCLSSHSANAQNLIVNGTFETGDLTGWTVTHGGPGTGNEAFFYYEVIGGNFSMFFNGGETAPIGAISQTIKTTPNTQYTLTFAYATFYGEPFAWPTPQSLNVTVSNSDLAPQVATSQAKSSSDPFVNNVLGPVRTFTYAFVAKGTSSTITFADAQFNYTFSEDGVLDNVVVTATGHANNGFGNGGGDGVPGKSGKSDKNR